MPEIFEQELTRLAQLIEDLDAKREVATNSLKALGEKIESLQLNSTFDDFNSSIQSVGQTVLNTGTSLVTYEITQSLNEFERLLQQGSTQVDGLLDNIVRFKATLRSQLIQLVQPIEELTDDAVGLWQHIEQDWESARSALEQRLDSLGDALEQWQEQVHSAMFEPVEEIAAQMQVQAENLSERIVETDVPDQIEKVAENLMGELTQVLNGFIDSFVSQTDRFVEVVLGHTEEGQGSRELLRPVLDELKGAVDLIEQELERVRDLASSVGVSF
jgi:phage-related protein